MAVRIAHLRGRRSRRGESGQIIVIAALLIVAMIAMSALVLEGGNLYAQQRNTQNGIDATANGGAVVLAAQLAGAARTDADVSAALNAIATANTIATHTGYYTNVLGQYLTSTGTVATSAAGAARVGNGAIPPGAQGVRVGGTRRVTATLARAIGFNTMDVSADATAVTGRLEGGAFLPVVFPINIVDCEKNGDLGVGETVWPLSQPPTSPGGTPVGQEFIVPLCKTGGGSFMILDLDGTKNNCDEEVTDPPPIQFDLPTDIASDNGNNCAKKMEEAVNALHGKVVLVPVCDVDCTTSGGSHATYHIVKVAAFFVDYMSDSNNKNNPACQGNGTTLITIRGNGSSSCIAGWFVRYIASGPVGTGTVGNSDAIGVQLIR